jgi:hypothetical protein
VSNRSKQFSTESLSAFEGLEEAVILESDSRSAEGSDEEHLHETTRLHATTWKKKILELYSQQLPQIFRDTDLRNHLNLPQFLRQRILDPNLLGNFCLKIQETTLRL